MLVAMRGEWAEFNLWQVPMGSRTQRALELCDVLVYRVERPEEAAETVAAALDIAYSGDLATAALLALGALATIGVQRPPNLAIAMFDNGHYGETGMQASHTAQGVELVAIARACGFVETFDIIDEFGLRDFAAQVHNSATTLFARIAIRTDEPPRVLPPRDGVLLKTRFRHAIGAE
jgi:thiamine pyrophosphate-dependent acetolactate synthase large subunit-like protein